MIPTTKESSILYDLLAKMDSVKAHIKKVEENIDSIRIKEVVTVAKANKDQIEVITDIREEL